MQTLFSGICAGLKSKKDLGLILFEHEVSIAGVTTQNRTPAHCVYENRKVFKRGRARAILINSGNANAATPTGLKDHQEVCKALAKELKTNAKNIVYASTGIIGVPLPKDKIIAALPELLKLAGEEKINDVADAILTTDLTTKVVDLEDKHYGFKIKGVAKGSGMIHPNMATMMCFLVTDATISPRALKQLTKEAADISFNQISVDTDTSTNDTFAVAATGNNKAKEIKRNSPAYKKFKELLDEASILLAKEIAKDGEGATKLIEVSVVGAKTLNDARVIARKIICSPLVKTAIHGGDNNWGRVYAAVGNAGVKNVVPEKIEIKMTELKTALPKIFVNLNLGQHEAKAWGCDLSHAYVDINTHYS